MFHAVLQADPIKQHLTRPNPEAGASHETVADWLAAVVLRRKVIVRKGPRI